MRTEMNGRRQRKLKWNKANYKELSCFKLPKSFGKRPRKVAEKLYPVNVIEKQDGRVKIHYVGYEDHFDEWRNEEEVEILDQDAKETESNVEPCEVLEPYSFYRDLGIKIKRALSCNRTASPVIKMAMPFDVIVFNGGLKSSGIPSKKVGGYQRYKIMHYKDLNHLLGQNWHVRGINSGGDYGYVVLDTVDFYLWRNRPLVDYICSLQNGPTACTIDAGYSLIFSFVFNYGSSDTFGKDDIVFYDKQ